MEDKIQKEKIREKFEKEFKKYYGIGITASCLIEVRMWWLNELDLAIKETEERLMREIEEVIKKYNPHPEQTYGGDELYEEIVILKDNLIRNK